MTLKESTHSRGPRAAGLLALALALSVSACSDAGVVQPASPRPSGPAMAALAADTVWISEFHYDNGGTDTGEFIEVSAPAGTDLSGWSIVRYNGSNGSTYGTDLLDGATLTTTTCGEDALVLAVVSYPSNGLQNGAPDGMALVDPAGTVWEFLSYEGSFSTTAGPAAGMTSVDIGVFENGSETGTSLQRSVTGIWQEPQPATVGGCNVEPGPAEPVDSVAVEPESGSALVGTTLGFSAAAFDASGRPTSTLFTWTSSDPAVATVDPASGVATAVATGSTAITATADNGVAGSATLTVVALPTGGDTAWINEFHYDNDGTDVNEAVEVAAPAGTDLTGWSVVLYNGNGGGVYDADPLGAATPATCTGEDLVLAVVSYPSNGIQNGPDAIALVDPTGRLVDFVSYEGSFTASSGPAAGFAAVDVGVRENNSGSADRSLQRDPSGAWRAAAANFGGCNPRAGLPGEPTVIIVSPGFVRLPEGYNRALFTSAEDDYGQRVDVPLSFATSDPAVVTVDQFGNLTAVGVGETTVTVSATGGGSRDVTVVVVPDVPSGVVFQDHTAFGAPTDGDPGDDVLVRRDEFVASFNPLRGGSNWVAWNLDGSHIGSQDRCDCYTPDPLLPAGVPQVVNFDYTGSGYSRGHMTQSFNRTATLPDNATTYLFSNILPQAQANNGGPWGSFEAYATDRALAGDEVYLIAGGEYASRAPTLKGEGKVAIPDYTWKVAVFLDRDEDLRDVRSLDDLELFAIRTPNRVEAGVRGSVVDELTTNDWRAYQVEVDQIEAAVGYDLLALLPDALEGTLESGLYRVQASFHRRAEAGDIDAPAANALGAQLDQAAKRLEQADPRQAAQRLRTFQQQLSVFRGNGKVGAAAAAELAAAAERVIAVLMGG